MKELNFNNVQLSEETILKTRKYFHHNALACIEEVKSGKVYVNDLEAVIKWETKCASDYIEGKNDHVLAFLQRAYYLQTGESVALINF